MDIKERRLKILVALFLAGGEKFDKVSINDAFGRAFDITFNDKTKSTFARLSRDQSIEHITEATVEGESLRTDILRYRLIEKGFRELCLSFPYFRYLRDSWDLKWRIVSYEIPERKREMRDKLRRQVAGWGLGPWHRSFWITTHPITQELKTLIKNNEEERYIQAFEADYVAGDRDILVEKVWKKSALDKRYQDAFKEWHLILSRDEDKLMKLQQITSIFISLLKRDPGLPEELTGQKWSGREAYKIYREVFSILSR